MCTPNRTILNPVLLQFKSRVTLIALKYANKSQCKLSDAQYQGYLYQTIKTKRCCRVFVFLYLLVYSCVSHNQRS